jgi:hypothetical protein
MQNRLWWDEEPDDVIDTLDSIFGRNVKHLNLSRSKSLRKRRKQPSK